MDIHISITFDVEGGFSATNLQNLSWKWKGSDGGIPLILEELRLIEDPLGNEMKFTWFVRVDNQLKEIYGDAGYLLILRCSTNSLSNLHSNNSTLKTDS